MALFKNGGWPGRVRSGPGSQSGFCGDFLPVGHTGLFHEVFMRFAQELFFWPITSRPDNF